MSGKKVEAIIDKNDRIIQRLEDAAIQRVNASLEAAYKQLEKELLRVYQTHSGNKSLLPNQRKLLILNEVQSLLRLVNPANEAVIDRAFQELLSQSFENGTNLAGQLTEAIATEQLQSFAGVPLQAVVLQAQESRNRLKNHSEQFASRASAIVEMGLIQGSGTQKIARQLRNELGITKGRAETIARTEALSSLNQAAQQTYKENNYKYVQVYATVDGRTCPICASRNQNIYKLGEVQVPFHPRCRCITVAIDMAWLKNGLVNVEESAKMKQDTIAAMTEATGKQPDDGLSPFEKAAGAEKPPEPVWKLGDVAPTPTPKPKYDRLPENHVVSTNPRYSPQAFDEALDQIQSAGAADRVALFREFVGKQGIQVVLYDQEAPQSSQLKHFKETIEYQKGANGKPWTDQDLKEATVPRDEDDGFTASVDRHIVVKVGGQRKTFEVEGKELQTIMDEVFAGVADNAADDAFVWGVGSNAKTRSAYEFSTYLHEMGHQVHYTINTPLYPEDVEGCLTNYSTTNSREWFAEHFAAWMLDAEGYAKLDPIGAKFIEDSLKQAVKADRRLT